jgi:hypothetical protein
MVLMGSSEKGSGARSSAISKSDKYGFVPPKLSILAVPPIRFGFNWMQPIVYAVSLRCIQKKFFASVTHSSCSHNMGV